MMKTPRLSIWSTAIAVLLGAAACKPRTNRSAPSGGPASSAMKAADVASSATKEAGAILPSLGRAPAWTLKDLDGNEVTSAQFRGKVMVVDFWATWCPPCRAEIPGYIELQKKYGKDGLVIVGVSLDQKGAEHVKKFVQTQGINYPVVLGDEEVVKAFGGVEAIPTTFLIDRAGEIRDRKVGAVETSAYERRIAALFN